MRSAAVCYLLCAISGALSGALAFTSTPRPPSRGAAAVTTVGSTVESLAEASSTSSSSSSPPAGGFTVDEKNRPTWEVKQHLYGLDMIKEAGSSAGGAVASVTVDADGGVDDTGGALPLPKTYITCGKCKALFAIAESDLGDKGKGCRVKCSVCGSSWYQSRERLFDIPTNTHDMIPASQSELGRIARNIARDVSPNFQGVSKLYVGNLDWRTTADELLAFFEANARKEGDDSKPVDVCDVSIVMGQDGRSRGFAFVSFYDESDGRAALACNGLECNGRELAVREPNN